MKRFYKALKEGNGIYAIKFNKPVTYQLSKYLNDAGEHVVSLSFEHENASVVFKSFKETNADESQAIAWLMLEVRNYLKDLRKAVKFLENFKLSEDFNIVMFDGQCLRIDKEAIKLRRADTLVTFINGGKAVAQAYEELKQAIKEVQEEIEL